MDFLFVCLSLMSFPLFYFKPFSNGLYFQLIIFNSYIKKKKNVFSNLFYIKKLSMKIGQAQKLLTLKFSSSR